jgi:glutamate racemase
MIGIFDSGIGGLTIVNALRAEIPNARILYLGDVARMPYGNKSAATVRQYAREISRYLIARGARLILIACNTASAVAGDALRRELTVPVFDVIAPAVAAALALPGARRIGVLGTRGTVASQAYQRALEKGGARRCDALACPMFVPLVEEGYHRTKEGRAIVGRTLAPFRRSPPDAVILGCTHYPLLRSTIQAFLPGVRLIDSRSVAARVREELERRPELAAAVQAGSGGGRLELTTTDWTDQLLRFARQIVRGPAPIGHRSVSLDDLATGRVKERGVVERRPGRRLTA